MVFGSPEIGSLDGDTVVAQYFKGRGNYCTKCFRLHRACYADNMGLALLEDWLSVEDSRAEWNIRLAASCVLRQTGSACVQLQDIVLMAQQFHQMAQILSLPSRPFQVVPLELYAASEMSSHEPVTMDRVINIAGGDGTYSLGVMVPIQVKWKPALYNQPPMAACRRVRHHRRCAATTTIHTHAITPSSHPHHTIHTQGSTTIITTNPPTPNQPPTDPPKRPPMLAAVKDPRRSPSWN